MIYALTLALCLTQMADWYSTRVILRRGGYERNKLTAWLFAHFGMDTVLAVKTVAVTVIGYWIGLNDLRLLAGAVAVYVGVLGYNWRSMPK